MRRWLAAGAEAPPGPVSVRPLARGTAAARPPARLPARPPGDKAHLDLLVQSPNVAVVLRGLLIHLHGLGGSIQALVAQHTPALQAAGPPANAPLSRLAVAALPHRAGPRAHLDTRVVLGRQHVQDQIGVLVDAHLQEEEWRGVVVVRAGGAGFGGTVTGTQAPLPGLRMALAAEPAHAPLAPRPR